LEDSLLPSSPLERRLRLRRFPQNALQHPPEIAVAAVTRHTAARSTATCALTAFDKRRSARRKETETLTFRPTLVGATITTAPLISGRVADTPPPSPGGESGTTKIDTQGIDDEIVVGVIEQLQKTGNRPHLLKELALVLSPIIPIVERYVPNFQASKLRY
jgi:hypothetical protein